MKKFLMKKYAEILMQEMVELCNKKDSFLDALAVNTHVDHIFSEESNGRVPQGTWMQAKKMRDEYNKKH